MTDEILIWGAGAIGGTIGAYLARAGVPVRMVDIVDEHVTACSDPGLRIEGPVEEFMQSVPCVTPGQVDGTWQRIILAVKAQATEDAMHALLPHLAADGFVLSAQNGLNERVIARIAGHGAHDGRLRQFRRRLAGARADPLRQPWRGRGGRDRRGDTRTHARRCTALCSTSSPMRC